MRQYLITPLILLTALSAAAQEAAIGYVKTVSGEATVATSATLDKAVAARVGAPVYLGNVLRTGAKGTLGVTFKDETVMSFGPNTEITVDEYLYDPAVNKLRMNAKLTKGSMNYLSGVIAKLRPEGVSIVMPSATIGVRGTHFVVRVEE
ncbi:MAG TPA: FecR domain-containing protein [Accumulibacter sp.]|nr:FecR domain-containing protein [Accumulibacter sp.]